MLIIWWAEHAVDQKNAVLLLMTNNKMFSINDKMKSTVIILFKTVMKSQFTHYITVFMIKMPRNSQAAVLCKIECNHTKWKTVKKSHKHHENMLKNEFSIKMWINNFKCSSKFVCVISYKSLKNVQKNNSDSDRCSSWADCTIA